VLFRSLPSAWSRRHTAVAVVQPSRTASNTGRSNSSLIKNGTRVWRFQGYGRGEGRGSVPNLNQTRVPKTSGLKAFDDVHRSALGLVAVGLNAHEILNAVLVAIRPKHAAHGRGERRACLRGHGRGDFRLLRSTVALRRTEVDRRRRALPFRGQAACGYEGLACEKQGRTHNDNAGYKQQVFDL